MKLKLPKSKWSNLKPGDLVVIRQDLQYQDYGTYISAFRGRFTTAECIWLTSSSDNLAPADMLDRLVDIRGWDRAEAICKGRILVYMGTRKQFMYFESPDADQVILEVPERMTHLLSPDWIVTIRDWNVYWSKVNQEEGGFE
jgi:hypothetical protein